MRTFQRQTLRVFHLYKDYPPVYGGIEHHLQMLAEKQAADGHQVTVLVTNPATLPALEEIRGVKVVRFSRLATVASTPLTLGFLSYLRRNPHDVAHLHFPYPVGELSQLSAGRRQPFVISYHSDVVNPRQQPILRLYRPLQHRVLAGAARILVTSQNYLNSSSTLKPFTARCTVVPLGIDPQPFLVPKPDAARRARPVVLFLGRHRYYKGVDQLLVSLRQLEAELWIGGDGPMRVEWERLSGSLGLAERVRFLGDIPSETLPRVYAGADLFVLPSTLRAEAFGIVLLEAMAAGLPCVTTELGTGTSYIVRDGETGRVVQPGDPAALAEALQALLSDPALLQRMGAAGRARVLSEFTLDRMAERVESIYRTVLEGRLGGH